MSPPLSPSEPVFQRLAYIKLDDTLHFSPNMKKRDPRLYECISNPGYSVKSGSVGVPNTKSYNQRLLGKYAGPEIPGDLSDPREDLYGNMFCAKTISTYPKTGDGTSRSGDPIADRYSAQVFSQNLVVALADGCNWGPKARLAALNASTAFVEYVSQNLSGSAKGSIKSLLHGLCLAHNAVLDGEAEPGTTTLLGGSLLRLERRKNKQQKHRLYLGRDSSREKQSPPEEVPLSPNPRRDSDASPQTSRLKAKSKTGSGGPPTQPKWAFVCVTIGDCKAFHYSPASRTVTDITEGNRGNINDASDPGGRLGPTNVEAARTTSQLVCPDSDDARGGGHVVVHEA